MATVTVWYNSGHPPACPFYSGLCGEHLGKTLHVARFPIIVPRIPTHCAEKPEQPSQKAILLACALIDTEMHSDLPNGESGIHCVTRRGRCAPLTAPLACSTGSAVPSAGRAVTEVNSPTPPSPTNADHFHYGKTFSMGGGQRQQVVVALFIRYF